MSGLSSAACNAPRAHMVFVDRAVMATDPEGERIGRGRRDGQTGTRLVRLPSPRVFSGPRNRGLQPAAMSGLCLAAQDSRSRGLCCGPVAVCRDGQISPHHGVEHRQLVERHGRIDMVLDMIGHVPGDEAHRRIGEGRARVLQHVGRLRASGMLGQQIEAAPYSVDNPAAAR